MKTSWCICCTLLLPLGLVSAQEVATTNAATASPLGWIVDQEIPIEPPTVSREAWKEGRHGVMLQFIEAPNPLAPLNPLTPMPPKFQDATISRDHLTGRIMGLTLVKFEF
jgi:hypothetical protein